MIKSKQQKIIKNYEAAKLESSLVFQIDDDLISGIDAPTTKTSLSTRSSSTALTLC